MWFKFASHRLLWINNFFSRAKEPHLTLLQVNFEVCTYPLLHIWISSFFPIFIVFNFRFDTVGKRGGKKSDLYFLWYWKWLTRMSLNQEIPVAMTLVLNLQKEAQVDPHMPPVAPATLKLQNGGSDERNSYVWGTALYPRYMPTPVWVLQNPIFHFNQSEDRIRPWLIAENEK